MKVSLVIGVFALMFVACIVAQGANQEAARRREQEHLERMARFEERRKQFDGMREGRGSPRSVDMVCDTCKQIAEKVKASGSEEAAKNLVKDNYLCEDVGARFRSVCGMILDEHSEKIVEFVNSDRAELEQCVDIDLCDPEGTSDMDKRRNGGERMRELYRNRSSRNDREDFGRRRYDEDRDDGLGRRDDLDSRRAELDAKRRERNEKLREKLAAAGSDVDVDAILRDSLDKLGEAGGSRVREDMEERMAEILGDGESDRASRRARRDRSREERDAERAERNAQREERMKELRSRSRRSEDDE